MNTAIWLGVFALIAIVIVLARLLGRPKKELPAGVSIQYTRHATQRMSERGVTAAEIEAVLADPARSQRDPLENSVRLERDFSGDRILKVWVAEPWPAKREVVIKSTAWKYLTTFRVPTGTVARVIGNKGATVQSLRDETGASISVKGDGSIRISAGDRASVETARRLILEITTRPDTARGSMSRGRGAENMAKNRASGKSASKPGGVSSARPQQKSGSSYSFGGYTKVEDGDGMFRMRKSDK